MLVQEFNIMLDKGFMLSVYDIFAHQQAEENRVRLGHVLFGFSHEKCKSA